MSQGGWGIPGVGADRTVTESEILWGSDQVRSSILWKSGVISGTTRDAGNTPTTILRPGLILGKLDSSENLYEEWNADVATGTQNFAGVLDTELRAQDFDATNADRVFRVLVGRAAVKARRLLIEGAAFLGHANEYLARRQMVAAGFVFDDDPQGYLGGLGNRFATVTGTSDTLTALETGTTLFYSSASAVAVTLPTLQAGLVYEIVRTGDEEIVVSSAAGNDMLVGNDASASSITFTTAGQHIGATIRVEGVYVGTTLKWKTTLPPAPFGTGTATLAYGIT
jgi:hypothetical protein